MTIQAEKTKKGLKWSVLDQLVKQLITLVISGVLSRLLSPVQYGLLGMVMVATGFFQVLKDVGFGASIIHKQDIGEDEKSSLFWLNTILGVVMAFLLILIAPVIALFFEEPQLDGLVKVVAINLIITSMSIVPDALIQKAMDFKNFFLRNLWTTIGSGIFGIWLAYKGYGVWSLLAQMLLTSLLGLFISFRITNWRPRFIFKINLIKSHFKYSVPIFADNSINYWVRNIDKLLVGKILGAVSLGIYNRAYSLMLLPLTQVSQTINRVMFPSFALIQNETQRIWTQYCKVIAVIVLICFPLMATLGIYANEVILIIYGKGWVEAVPIFMVLSFLGAFQCVATMAGAIYYSTGKTFLMFKVGILSRTLMVSGIVGGIYYGGLMGMVWGYFATSMLSFFIELYFVCIVLGGSIRKFVNTLLPEIISVSAFVVFLFLSKSLFRGRDQELTLLYVIKHLITGTVILFVYVLLLNKFKSEGLKLLKANLYERTR